MSTRATPRRLLALDLDGTLVRADGVIDVRDRAAVSCALRKGTFVTLASGRLAPSVIGIARGLDIGAPLVCADGAAIVCPRTGSVMESAAIDEAPLTAMLDVARAHSLAPFLGFPHALVGDPSGVEHACRLRGWTSSIACFSCLEDAIAMHGDVVLALAVGPRDRVESAHEAALRAAGEALDLATFGLGEGAPWALRAQRRGVSKGVALARIAARLGVPRARVAAVGDWLNDLSMLHWAGTSFAMGHGPEVVRRAADVVLDATSTTGGGVEEVIHRWIDA